MLYAIGSVPSLSGRAIAYRWRSLPRVRRHRVSKHQGSSKRVLPWQVTMDQLICASLSRSHSWWTCRATSTGSDVPSRVSLLILHTQAESGALITNGTVHCTTVCSFCCVFRFPLIFCIISFSFFFLFNEPRSGWEMCLPEAVVSFRAAIDNTTI